MIPTERERHIREIAQRLAERLAAEWPEGDTTVNAIEDLAERLGHEVQREISERCLRDEAARKEGNQTACPCGACATYRRHYSLPIVTAAGRLEVRRAYYYCDHCRTGQCPADQRLGLGPANTTPTAQARLAVLSALSPYVQVADLVAQLGLPLQLDLKSTERVAQAVGEALKRSDWVPYGRATRPVALGFDGIMFPTWEGNKEARGAVIDEPAWDAARTPAGEAGLRKEYLATTGSRESLVGAACARARARAGGGVVAVVCDGAALDWVELDPHLPLRVEILDFYHVLERLGEIAKVIAPATAGEWQATLRAALLKEGPNPLLVALRAWEPEGEAAAEVKRVQLAYFERQQGRMQYPEYLRRGFPIGSGAVEGACKHVVADRFDGGGMRWKRKTADPLLQLRAALLTQPHLDLRSFLATQPAALAA
ncbi:MAG: ISKra4 family transposase [Solirubrobacteraceae bacterium]